MALRVEVTRRGVTGRPHLLPRPGRFSVPEFRVAKNPPVVLASRMSRIPLEDNFNDILGKARRGLKIPDTEIVRLAGVTPGELVAALAGEVDEAVIRKLAGPLRLHSGALADLAAGRWYPDQPGPPAGLAMFTTPYRDMTVNSFLVWDPVTREAAAFDTGATCDGMLELVKKEGLRITQIFLTHTHPDHIADLEELARDTGAEVFTEERELVKVPATTFREGSLFRIGALTVEALFTGGHSPGQTTFFVTGLALPVAIVGDSLFAGSMGGGADHFAEQLRNTGGKILTLPGETLIAPGHGPFSTVAQERRHNPFFAK